MRKRLARTEIQNRHSVNWLKMVWREKLLNIKIKLRQIIKCFKSVFPSIASRKKVAFLAFYTGIIKKHRISSSITYLAWWTLWNISLYIVFLQPTQNSMELNGFFVTVISLNVDRDHLQLTQEKPCSYWSWIHSHPSKAQDNICMWSDLLCSSSCRTSRLPVFETSGTVCQNTLWWYRVCNQLPFSLGLSYLSQETEI